MTTFNETVREIAQSVSTDKRYSAKVLSLDSVNRIATVLPQGSTSSIRVLINEQFDIAKVSINGTVIFTKRNGALVLVDIVQTSSGSESSTLNAVIEDLAIRIAQLESQVATLIRQNQSGSVQQALAESLPRTVNRGG